MLAQILRPRNKKKPGYALKILSTAIMRKGRQLGNLTNDIEFKEEDTDGTYTISVR